MIDPLVLLGGVLLLSAVLFTVVLLTRRGVGADAVTKPQLRAQSKVSRQYLFLAVGFTAFAFYGSLVPFQFVNRSFANALASFQQLPLIPERVSRTDLATNVALMIPVAFCWMAVLGMRGASFAEQFVSGCLVFSACSCLAFANEFSQLWFQRVPSKLDIVAQMAGATIGISSWVFIGRAVTDWLLSYAMEERPGRQVEWLLEAYLIGFLLYSLMPFDLTANISELGRKLQSGRIELVPFRRFSWNNKTISGTFRDVIVFLPIGMLAAVWRTQPKRPVRSFLDAVILGTLAAGAIEVLQVFVRSRYSSITDVILAFIGVAVGVGIMRRWRRDSVHQSQTNQLPSSRSPLVWIALIFLYLGFLILPFWSPFDFDLGGRQVKSGLDGFFAAPFARLERSSTLSAISIILHRLLWFAPLGGLTAIWLARLNLSRPTMRYVSAVACLALAGCALFIEMGQILLPSRNADVTDALLASIGACMGLLLTSRYLSSHGTASSPVT